MKFRFFYWRIVMNTGIEGTKLIKKSAARHEETRNKIFCTKDKYCSYNGKAASHALKSRLALSNEEIQQGPQ